MAPLPSPGRFGPPGVPDPSARSARFDRWAADYDTSQLQQVLYEPVHHKVLDHARRRIAHPAHILDVGCGTGRLTAACTRYYPGVSTVGADPCAEMINHAASRPTAVWLRARAEALPFRDGVFDLIVSTLSLRHWTDPHQGLAEISRVTAPGGIIVIADAMITDVLTPPSGAISPGHPWRRSAPRLKIRLPGHLRSYTQPPADLCRVLKQTGLRLDHIEPIALLVPLTTVTLIAAGKLP